MAERNLNNLKIDNSKDLTTILSGVLLDIRRGTINAEMAKNIVSVADKINKNNANAINYKKVAKHENEIDFFEETT
jgi:hypothetical protein